MKILSLDIETAPKRAYVWGLWKQNVGTNQIISDWYMLTWSAKWYGEEEVIGERLTFAEAIKEDDKRLLTNLHELLEEADVVVAHNGKKFDVPSINTRFIINGILPPSPYRQIDTLTVAKRQFKFTSNRLDYIGKMLGVGRKIDTGGFELWERCMQGEDAALEEMLTYNKQDVLLLEAVYTKLRPFISNHPNHNVYTDRPCCPTCGSEHVHKKGKHHTNVSTFQRYKCMSCGAPSRARINERDTAIMKRQLIGVTV